MHAHKHIHTCTIKHYAPHEFNMHACTHMCARLQICTSGRELGQHFQKLRFKLHLPLLERMVRVVGIIHGELVDLESRNRHWSHSDDTIIIPIVVRMHCLAMSHLLRVQLYVCRKLRPTKYSCSTQRGRSLGVCSGRQRLNSTRDCAARVEG